MFFVVIACDLAWRIFYPASKQTCKDTLGRGLVDPDGELPCHGYAPVKIHPKDALRWSFHGDPLKRSCSDLERCPSKWFCRGCCLQILKHGFCTHILPRNPSQKSWAEILQRACTHTPIDIVALVLRREGPSQDCVHGSCQEILQEILRGDPLKILPQILKTVEFLRGACKDILARDLVEDAPPTDLKQNPCRGYPMKRSYPDILCRDPAKVLRRFPALVLRRDPPNMFGEGSADPAKILP